MDCRGKAGRQAEGEEEGGHEGSGRGPPCSLCRAASKSGSLQLWPACWSVVRGRSSGCAAPSRLALAVGCLRHVVSSLTSTRASLRQKAQKCWPCRLGSIRLVEAAAVDGTCCGGPSCVKLLQVYDQSVRGSACSRCAVAAMKQARRHHPLSACHCCSSQE